MERARRGLVVLLLAAVGAVFVLPAGTALAEATRVMMVSPREGDTFVAGQEVQIRVVAFGGVFKDWQDVQCVLIRPDDKVPLPLLERRRNLSIFTWKNTEVGQYGIGVSIYTSSGWLDGGTIRVTVVPSG
jgi:hypothetical protein